MPRINSRIKLQSRVIGRIFKQIGETRFVPSNPRLGWCSRCESGLKIDGRLKFGLKICPWCKWFGRTRTRVDFHVYSWNKRVYIYICACVCMWSSFDVCLVTESSLARKNSRLGITLEIFEERKHYQSRENEIRGNHWKMGLRNFLSRVFLCTWWNNLRFQTFISVFISRDNFALSLSGPLSRYTPFKIHEIVPTLEDNSKNSFQLLPSLWIYFRVSFPLFQTWTTVRAGLKFSTRSVEAGQFHLSLFGRRFET